MDVDLVLFKKDGSHKTFSLRDETTVIGREDDCDLYVPLISVSRKHCRLICNNQTVKIQDLKSKNGTYLNGQLIKNEAAAKAGDYITIGPLTFLLQINGEPRQVSPPKPAAPKPAPKVQPEAKVPAQPTPKVPAQPTPKAPAQPAPKAPAQPAPKEPPKKEPPKQEPEKELDLDDSFPDIDFDDSDSFDAELDDL